MLKKHIAAPRTPLAKLQYGKRDDAQFDRSSPHEVDIGVPPVPPATAEPVPASPSSRLSGENSEDEASRPSGSNDQEVEIPLGAIDVSPYQPRLVFEEQSLRELADSIEESGLINPILVRQKPHGRYELVAGERRFRAHQILRRLSIRASVRKLSDQDACLEALTDNEARLNLCDYERGCSYNRILSAGLVKSQGDLGRKIGVPKATISRCLSYFKLPGEALEILDKHPAVLGGTKASEFASEYFAAHREIIVEAIRMLAESGLTEDAAMVWAKTKVKAALGLNAPVATRPLNVGGRRLGEFRVEGRKIVITCAKGVDPEEVALALNQAAAE